MDASITKMLSIHIDALLPPTSAEIDVPVSVMSAAVIGIGLVYQSTAHRLMTEVLLSEIGEYLSGIDLIEEVVDMPSSH